MADGKKASRPAGRSKSGIALGFVLGLATGLVAAAVVAVYVTKAPVPFMNKSGRASERLEPPRAGDMAPDPNRPLANKGRMPGEVGSSADAQSILDIFKDAPPVPARPEPAAEAPVPAPRPAPLPAPSSEPYRNAEVPVPMAAPAPAPEAPRSSFLLQAGAFREQNDADGMKARLALLGLEARVIPAEVDGRPMYRVRVGPYPGLEDMNRARAKLAENGVDATVIRQRP